jgi:hypothetical protein
MWLRVVLRLMIVEAVRSLARNVVRSGLAVLGIAVAVAIVITVIALGRASIEASEAELDKLGDNLVWVEAGSRNVAGARTGSHGMTTLIAQDADAIRREIPLIKARSSNVAMSRPPRTPLYNLVDRRHGRVSTAVTSNIGLSDWGHFLGDATLTAASLDRLAMHAIRIDIDSPSYRQYVAGRRATGRAPAL